VWRTTARIWRRFVKHSAGMVEAERIWVLADDRAGNRSQALGVAARLGRPFTVKEIAYGAWAKLPNVMLGASLLGVSAATQNTICAPWPDMVIAAGRRTAPVALAIKRRSQGRSKLVQVMNPGLRPGAFDLIARPSHDPELAGTNVLTVVGAPHGLTATLLSEARVRWLPELEALPAPRIALIVGGSTRRRQFTDAMARDLGARASAMAKSAGGSLMIAASRRTGLAGEALIAAVDCPHRAYRWGDAGDNPYQGFLACADAVVVTGDSVSMCSEACGTDVPVQVFQPEGLITEKHARFHRDLFAGGHAEPFTGVLGTASPPVLDAAGLIAREIGARGLL
jgi:mitochondrial fission protein ELM1